MPPVFIYYSMFGFQRVGDLICAAADQRTRGFLLGATGGRTTLSGEGLQHEDRSSYMVATTIPNCRAHDPAVIMDRCMARMLDEKRDEFFYVTAINENYAQPTMLEGVEADIIRGLYKLRATLPEADARVRVIGSGTILLEVIAAAEILEKYFGIAADVFSATSYTDLAHDVMAAERQKRFAKPGERRTSHLEATLPGDRCWRLRA